MRNLSQKVLSMSSESQKKASAKYDKANTVKVTVKLNRKTDKDCIDKFEEFIKEEAIKKIEAIAEELEAE